MGKPNFYDIIYQMKREMVDILGGDSPSPSTGSAFVDSPLRLPPKTGKTDRTMH